MSILPKGEYVFTVGMPKLFLQRSGEGKRDSYGIHFGLTVALPSNYENKETVYSASFNSTNDQRLAKQFMMACLGYGKGRSEEERFNRDQSSKEWSFKPADGTVGDVWTQLAGTRVIGALDPQPNQNRPEHETHQFTSWRSISSGPLPTEGDASTGQSTSQPVLVERETRDVQVESPSRSQIQAIGPHSSASASNLSFRRLWLICRFGFLIPACFALFFALAYVSFDFTRYRSTIGGLLAVALGLFMSILLPGALKESWDELSDISNEDTMRALEGKVNWGPPAVATVLVVLSIFNWPSAFYSILRTVLSIVGLGYAVAAVLDGKRILAMLLGLVAFTFSAYSPVSFGVKEPWLVLDALALTLFWTAAIRLRHKISQRV